MKKRTSKKRTKRAKSAFKKWVKAAFLSKAERKRLHNKLVEANRLIGYPPRKR